MSENKTNIQWYPGHMTKAKREMQADIRMIDVIIELVDARIPYSSKNPDIETMSNGKHRIILLNKSDLADKNVTAKWEQFYKDKGYFVIALNSKKKNETSKVSKRLHTLWEEKTAKDRKKGILNRPIRAMIVGIPNVGKSTFINTYTKRAATKTGNKPGVTRGKQWIHIDKSFELLDTPGILWPKFEDQVVGINLALIGSIRDEIIEKNDLSLKLIDKLKESYPGKLAAFYDIDENRKAADILMDISKNRNCIKAGAEIDYDKGSALILDDFRNARIGYISLEQPNL